MATAAIYKFLKDQNRPFSPNDVAQNIGKEHGKSAIQKSLDELVSKNKIIEKVYGKQKIYSIAQEDVTNPTETSNELRELDQKITDLTENLKKANEELQKNSNELKNFQGQMSIEEAKTERDKLKTEISELQIKLENLQNNIKPISDEEKTQTKSEYEKYLKEYKKRKRICMDIVNGILEGYPKTKKHLFEDIGIETDEDVGFKLQE